MTAHKISQILSGAIMMMMMASRISAFQFLLPRIRPVATRAAATVVGAARPTTTTRLFSVTASTPSMVLKRVKTIDAVDPTEESVVVKGWVRTIRKQKTLAFVQVNDGSNLKGIQCVVSFDEIDDATKGGELKVEF